MQKVATAKPLRAKINDVAERAGVSIKTVSRVLNNEPNVRSQTRKKVKTAMAALNYVPDFSARSLAGQRSYMLALFYDSASPSYLSKFQTAVLGACRSQHYHLIVDRCENDNPAAGDLIAGIAAKTRLDGVILIPPLSDNLQIRVALEAARIGYVLVAPIDADCASLQVRMDDEQAAYEATQRLIEAGHKRIGHILGHPAHGASVARRSGFQRAMADARLDVRPDWLVQGDFTIASGKSAGRALLDCKPRPTAVFAANDDMAAGLASLAAAYSLNLPDDLSIIGFDNSEIAEIVSPPLSTVRQPITQMAEGAVEMLVKSAGSGKASKSSENETMPTIMSFDFEFISRASVAPFPEQEDPSDG